jgi:vitamin B12 transporter
LALRASAGTGFKAPTFAENFANSPYEVGNPDLAPERSRSWEVAAEYELAPAGLQASLTWYDQRFRDLIQYVGAAPGEPTYQNLGAALARGLEASVSGRPLPAIQLGGSWSWLDTRVTDAGASTSPGFREGGRLLRRPANQLRLWTGVTPRPGVGLNLELRYTGDRDDVDFGSFPAVLVTLPAYTLVNLSASADVLPAVGRRPGVTLVARLQNAFGAKYQEIFGFPGRPRTVMAGARVSW